MNFKDKLFKMMLTSLSHVTSMLSGHFKPKAQHPCKYCGNLTTHNKELCSSSCHENYMANFILSKKTYTGVKNLSRAKRKKIRATQAKIIQHGGLQYES